ncbi:hypothetical protein FB446DRAFT_787840 [Lentinula raphanica]|nr:hypothetical protein FB446DRAFT_787840 [Lentinula raphanica]
MSSSPFATQENPQALWYEQSMYDSAHLASVGYGIHVAVYSTVTYIMLQQKPSSGKTCKNRAWIGWLVFNFLLFAMGTINLACSIRYNQNAWVNDREYPGGPYAYLIEQGSIPVMTLGNVASILASFLADALLLYRTAILWNFVWYIVIPPALFYIACVVLSILTVVQLALPTQTHWTPLSLAVWIVLMIMPMWLSALIVGRIWYQKARIANVLGKEDTHVYTSISAIIIESALPFTVISIILLGLFGSNNIGQNLFVPLLVQVECIAPEMIILRVMLGRAWTRHTFVAGGEHLPRTALEFAPASQGATTTNSVGLTTSSLCIGLGREPDTNLSTCEDIIDAHESSDSEKAMDSSETVLKVA